MSDTDAKASEPTTLRTRQRIRKAIDKHLATMETSENLDTAAKHAAIVGSLAATNEALVPIYQNVGGDPRAITTPID